MKRFAYKLAATLSLLVWVIMIAGCQPTVIVNESIQTSFTAPPLLIETVTGESIQPSFTPLPPLVLTIVDESALQGFTPLPPLIVTVVDEPIQPSFTPLPTSTETQQSAATITITPTFCPLPTPELLWVAPVTLPTDQLTQIIQVYIGNGEEVKVKTESGTFTVTGAFNHYDRPALVEITLLPDTVHHLEVTARVKSGLRGPNNCVYGGYILSTTRDKNGAPLVIAQGAATP